MQAISMTQTAWHISNHIYDENYPYPYTYGERKDEELNKKIISLAKRNKFYVKQIQSVLREAGTEGYEYQIHVAKQVWGKSYKVVGFIIYNLLGGGFGLGSLEYWLVDPKFQGKGIGKLLYLQAEKMLNACNCPNLSVMFDKSDPKMCAIYTRLGFKLIKKYAGIPIVNIESERHTTWVKIAISSFCLGDGVDLRVYEGEEPIQESVVAEAARSTTHVSILEEAERKYKQAESAVMNVMIELMRGNLSEEERGFLEEEQEALIHAYEDRMAELLEKVISPN